MNSQNERLLNYLKTHKTINPLEAWSELGIYRLGARVWDLRAMGYNIQQDRIKVFNRFKEVCRVAEYRLFDEVSQGETP